VVVVNHSTKGKILTAHGNLITATGAADTVHTDFTLYTFDSDPIGRTTCTAGCLAAWPALYAPANATAFGDFTIVARDSTTNQWAYKGKPLYFYVGDGAAGDVNGEYTNWTIARP
jgi:predicted lipoprotein with Yx(FWY)xxD motif